MVATITEIRPCSIKRCRCHEIEIPQHCPLCHKFMGHNVFNAIMDDGSVVCVHCYRLEQIADIDRRVIEMPDWLKTLRDGWRSAKDLARCWRPSYRRSRRRMFVLLGESMADSVSIAA